MENITQGQWFGTTGSDIGEPINQSLRFNSAGSTQLTRTLGTPTDRDRWTFSVWVKKSKFDESTRQVLLSGYGASNDNQWLDVGYESLNGLYYTSNGLTTNTNSTAVYRDPSAWQHVVVTWDGSNLKFYSNGVRVINDTQLSGDVGINGPHGHTIGNTGNGTQRINCYMAEMNFLDGTLVGESTVDGKVLIDEFGRYNSLGVWVPKAINFTSDQYGANGFRLTFASDQHATASTAIGIDSAPTGGNHASANNWSSSGFNTSAISNSNTANDIDFKDTPTANYATGNPLNKINGLEKGALGFVSATNTRCKTESTQHFPQSGVWQMEYKSHTAYQTHFGFKNSTEDVWSTSADYNGAQWKCVNNGSFIANGTDVGGISSTSNGDIWTVVLDFDNDTGKWYRNNTLEKTITSIPAPANYYNALMENYGNANEFNFGQTDFRHTPVSGAKALQLNNHPEPTIKNGRDHFDVLTYDGAGGSQTITGLNFTPDFVWIKYRSGTDGHILQNSVRGVNKGVQSGSDAAEFDDSTTITSFNSNGFTVGGNAQTNTSGRDYCAWCWKAGGAPTATNDNAAGSAQDAGSVKVDGSDGSFAHGTIAVKKMSVNTTAGFSIVEYTGTGSAGTIPHGLGKVPQFAFIKRTDGTGDFDCYHVSLGNQRVIKLNSSSAKSATGTGYYNNTSPTSTVFSIGAGGANNTSGENYIGFFWAPIDGFSSFGQYVGHSNSGTNIQGDFVYTGFKPSMIMVKNLDTGGGWVRLDTARSTANPCKINLSPANVSEATLDGGLDFLANGFKVRQGGGELGDSGLNFAYMAWAENPMGGENVAPATAR